MFRKLYPQLDVKINGCLFCYRENLFVKTFNPLYHILKFALIYYTKKKLYS